MTVLRFNRDQLIEALEARRHWAEKLDKKRLAKHARDEAAHLAAFHAGCRAALKWDYATAKGNYFRTSMGKSSMPSCPRSLVAQLDASLNSIFATRQERFVIDDRGTWSTLHYLLTFDERIKAEMC